MNFLILKLETVKMLLKKMSSCLLKMVTQRLNLKNSKNLRSLKIVQ